MLIIDEIIKQEKERNNKMLIYYEKIIADSPKGSIEIKKIANEKYVYLKFREKDKIISKYCGKLFDNMELLNLIEKRKHAENMLKKLKDELNKIERIERIL